MAVAGIHAIIVARASNGMLGRKNKLADFVTSELVVASEYSVRSLGEDDGANVCSDHLLDKLLDSEISSSLSLSLSLSITDGDIDNYTEN